MEEKVTKAEKEIVAKPKTTRARKTTSTTGTRKSTTTKKVDEKKPNSKTTSTRKASTKSAKTTTVKKKSTTGTTRKTATSTRVKKSDETVVAKKPQTTRTRKTTLTSTKEATVKSASVKSATAKAKAGTKSTKTTRKSSAKPSNKRLSDVINYFEEEEIEEESVNYSRDLDVDFDTKLKRIEEERKSQKVIPPKEKSKIYGGAFSNIIAACFVTVVLIIINVVFKKGTEEVIKTLLDCTTILTLVLTLVIFEIAYKKDDDSLAFHGIEMMLFAFFNLASVYLAIMKPEIFVKLMAGTAAVFEMYYLVKALFAVIKRKKKYYRDSNEMKKLVKKRD